MGEEEKKKRREISNGKTEWTTRDARTKRLVTWQQTTPTPENRDANPRREEKET